MEGVRRAQRGHNLVRREDTKSVRSNQRVNKEQRRQSQRPFQSSGAETSLARHEAMDALQEKKRTLLVAVDCQAAFDRVWRDRLPLDLALMGLKGRCLRWLRAWLSDRLAAVRWNEEKQT